MKPILNKYLLYYPIQLLRREHPWSFVKKFRSVGNYSRDELREYQIACINRLLAYTSKHVPFYRNLTRDGIKSLRDVQDLPILSKKDIMKAAPSLKSRQGFLIHSVRSTSGTTGAPFCFIKDRLATSAMEAAMYYAYSWHGLDIGDEQARIWGTSIHPKARLMQRIKDLALNRQRLSSFDMSEESCIEYYRVLRKFKPKYIYAYAHALYRFVQVLNSSGIDARELNIKLSICTGERLFDYQRNLIESALGCPVVNEYGATECGIIAFECRHRTMHILSQTIFLETIRPDGSRAHADEEGDVVITELYSRSIPFIRYKTGDRAALSDESCACGRDTPVIKNISGRIDDFIIRPDGKYVYDAILAYAMKDYALQFKAVQTDMNTLIIYIIPLMGVSAKKEAGLRGDLRKYIGTDMEIRFVYTGRIEIEPSGKYRYFQRDFKADPVAGADSSRYGPA
ncbi:MAG: hypothetical protein M1510_11325 [Nitrospirae bacterium]|nr:hypothetical protein [Nitrospirota bacterium]